jgi:hypothetical protein
MMTSYLTIGIKRNKRNINEISETAVGTFRVIT